MAATGAKGGTRVLDRRSPGGHGAQEARVRLRCRDPQAEGADRSGLAVHDLLVGLDNPILGETVRKLFREALPAGTVKVFEGLGPNPFWEDPQAVAGVINKFV